MGEKPQKRFLLGKQDNRPLRFPLGESYLRLSLKPARKLHLQQPVGGGRQVPFQKNGGNMRINFGIASICVGVFSLVSEGALQSHGLVLILAGCLFVASGVYWLVQLYAEDKKRPHPLELKLLGIPDHQQMASLTRGPMRSEDARLHPEHSA